MKGWNHNTHYDKLVLRAVRPNLERVLDVGCGTGRLAAVLAARCREVVAVDCDHDAITRARSSHCPNSVTFVEADVMNHRFPQGSFDCIVAVASLHHLPMKPALARFRSLLKNGGSLMIVGLYRSHTIQDYMWAVVALPISWLVRTVYGSAEVGAPVRDPMETLVEIRDACAEALPGATFRRHLFFRYSVIWRKP